MYKSLIRTIASTTLACIVSAAVAVTPVAAAAPKVEVNGRPLYDNLARIENGRLLIGLRSAAEALGATVDWHEADQRIIITRGAHQTTLWVGHPTARINGKLTPLDVPPRILQGRTLIPYRFVGESLGALVGWDAPTQTAWLWSALVPYRVQSGESLWSISRQYGISAEQLRRTNGMQTDTLVAGQTLLVPEAPVTSAFATVSGYAVITSRTDTRSLRSIQQNGAMLTDVAVVSHRLRADGSLSGSLQEEIQTAAHQQGLRPWLVVQNLDTAGSFSRTIADTVLKSATARQKFAKQVVSVLKSGGFVGLELDIEDISPGSRAYFTLLLKELKQTLAANGFLLGVAVPAKVADSPKDEWNGAFDYKSIGAYADRVTLMTYDEHWFGGPNGPIASLPWVERVLRYSTETIGAGKLLLGVAAYAYDWPVNGGTADILSAREVVEMAAAYGSRWDEKSASPYIAYWDRYGGARMLWYEDQRSLTAKFNLARSFGLQGIHLWRLGLEDAGIWNSLNQTP